MTTKIKQLPLTTLSALTQSMVVEFNKMKIKAISESDKENAVTTTIFTKCERIMSQIVSIVSDMSNGENDSSIAKLTANEFANILNEIENESKKDNEWNKLTDNTKTQISKPVTGHLIKDRDILTTRSIQQCVVFCFMFCLKNVCSLNQPLTNKTHKSIYNFGMIFDKRVVLVNSWSLILICQRIITQIKRLHLIGEIMLGFDCHCLNRI